MRENKIKSEFIVSKFKRIDRNQTEAINQMKRMMEVNRKNIITDINKMKQLNELQGESNQHDMQRLKEEVAKDRELMNAELCKYDDAIETKRTIDKEIAMLRDKLRKEMDEKFE